MCYSQEFNATKKKATSTQDNGKYCRMCTTCGDVFNDGFLFNGGSMYFCSEECRGEEMKISDWDEACDQFPDDNYYTEWDADSDAEYEVKDGIIYLLETGEIVFFDEKGEPYTDHPMLFIEEDVKPEQAPEIVAPDSAEPSVIVATLLDLTDKELHYFNAFIELSNKHSTAPYYYYLNGNRLTVSNPHFQLSNATQIELLNAILENRMAAFTLNNTVITNIAKLTK